MNPLKVKATGSPITSANISGLQTMTDAEVKNYIANVITEKFAAVTDGTGTAELNITTNNSGSGTSIGTFVDTNRTESIGTHPATGSVSTTTYYVKQVTASATENITNRPLAWDSRLEEMADGDIDSTMDLCIDAMVEESAYTAGQYKLQPTAPSGGTWVARYTLTDTAQGGNTVTYLWQKTVASSAPSADYTPLKVFNGSNCKQMTEAEIEQMLPVFRNRIIETGIGTYKIQTDAPSGGTWIQTGNTFTDTREEVSPQNYAGNFTGNFTGNFSGNFVGVANYSGSRTYSGNYLGGGTFTGTYSGSRTYSGNYAGAGTFTGTYSGSRTYSGNYAGTGSFVGPQNYSGSRTYSGNYAGTGNFVGPANYSGSRTYSGNYAGNFSGNYTGNYSGSRTYSGDYAQNFLSPEPPNFVGFYSGSRNYAGNYVGDPGPAYSGFFEAQAYAGYFLGAPTGYAGTPYTIYQPTPNGLDTVVFFETPFFSGPGIPYTGYFQAGFWTADYPPGNPGFFQPLYYQGSSYSLPGGTFSGSRNYADAYIGFYAAPNVNYTGFFSGSRNYAGNYAGTYLGTYGGFFSGSRNYAGNYAGTGTFVGPANYSGDRNYGGNYLGTGTFVGPANYSGSRNYSGNYVGNYGGGAVYSGSRNYSGNYVGNYGGPVNYSGDRNYSGLYNGPANYSGNYSSAFSGNFSGTFSGATIQATKETVSSVKLWIRTA
jgi:hypothetical protein